ncbi:heme utilization cystosolic carrier protein HutX [Nitrincola sp. A-D6]|uniref:heme utilization cystosolic carrier protein HutX n=1 Tax=Nitrincola sp. A-D6 TaxID=1545442 RepID=UPI001F2761F7|nr:heme utilization cystosolic carrier protein HutX [Nitrincola sp. A-D6]
MMNHNLEMIMQENLIQQVETLMREKPQLRPVEMAEQLKVSEWAVVSALPGEMVYLIKGNLAEAILQDVSHWGAVTTIVERDGSIFEFKGSLPEGKPGFGYYNLMGEAGQMHGHLKLNAVANIALLSKPLRGKEAHAIVFYNRSGACVFKIYLGRDAQGLIHAHQLQAFNRLKGLGYAR